MTRYSSPTDKTRTGERNMTNRKPFRTKAQKEEARRTAYKCKDGTWRSDAPTSLHKGPNS